MSKRARRERKRERRHVARQESAGFGKAEGAPEFAHIPRPHLELCCHTLDRLLALRNIVIADLLEHLSDDHKALLGWPLCALDPEVAARVRARLPVLEP